MVRLSDGEEEGASVRFNIDGERVGLIVGNSEGSAVGVSVGFFVGRGVGGEYKTTTLPKFLMVFDFRKNDR